MHSRTRTRTRIHIHKLHRLEMYNRYAQKISWNVCLSECIFLFDILFGATVVVLCCMMVLFILTSYLSPHARWLKTLKAVRNATSYPSNFQLDMNTPQ